MFKQNRSTKPRFTREELLEKKRKYLENNAEIARKGGRPRKVPQVFRNLPYVSVPGYNRPTRGSRPRRRNNKERKAVGKAQQTKSTVPKKMDNSIKQKVDKLEKKVGGKVYTPVVTQKTKLSMSWDITGLQFLVEVMASDLSMRGDIFLSITPCEFAFYCVYVACIYLQRFGGLTQATWIPLNADKNDLPVPNALAKYLEYLAPYNSKSLDLSTTLQIAGNTFFKTPPSYTSLGQNTGVWNFRPEWFPNWRILPANESAESPSDNNHTVFCYNNVDGYDFSTFIGSVTNIGRVAAAINSRTKCVAMKSIATKAPDSTAYSRLLQPYPLTVGNAYNIRGFDMNYDPELTQIFSPSDGSVSELTNANVKPFPIPNIQRPYPLFGPNGQIASVWQYIASINEYKPGRFRDVFTFYDDKLVTLYPDQQTCDSVKFSENVSSSNLLLASAQGAGATPYLDTNDTQKIINTMVYFSLLQQKQNESEVLHWNVPPCADDSGTLIYIPQLFYTDSAFNNVSVPMQIAAGISVVGPIVKDGRLRVPSSDYKNVLTHAEGPIVGPMYWATYGYSKIYDDSFPFHTLYTTGFGPINGATPNTPVVIVDNTTVPITYYSDGSTNWVTLNYGAQPSYQSFEFVHPAIPTGAAAAVLITQYNDNFSRAMYGQAPLTVPLGTNPKGDPKVMTSVYTIDSSQGTVLANQNVYGSGEVATGTVYVSPDTIASVDPDTDINKAHGGTVAVSITNNDITRSSSVQSLYHQMKAYKLRYPGSSPVYTTREANSNNITDFPWGAGFSGLLMQLAKETMLPSGKVADAVQKAIDKGDFDPVEMIRTQCENTFKKSMKGTAKSNMEVGEYMRRNLQSRPTKKESKGFTDSMFDTIGKCVNVSEKAFQTVNKVAGLAGALL